MTESIDMLVHSDRELFLWLNGMNAPWLDGIMYWITYKYTWIPMYLGLIVVSLSTDRRKGFIAIVAVLLAVIVADQITSGFMKPYFIRFRPCHDPAIQSQVHTVAGCGGMYGFASSHASTSFALAFTWYQILKDRLRHIWLIFAWAALYSYSRVYVGVHFPADILVGATIGLTVGWLFTWLYHSFLRRYYLT
jgi:undecaprenyl-diphosphatase